MTRTLRALTGLLVIAALVAAGAVAGANARRRAPAPRTVLLTIHHSAFSTGHLDVDPGSTVTFVVHNTDPIDHEFILGNQEVQDRHETGTDPHHGALPGEISVPAGQTVRTTFTFGEPGRLLFGCHLPGHYAYGMRGTVTIA